MPEFDDSKNISRGISDEGVECSTAALHGPYSRGRARTCDHPPFRRCNPNLHHRPNLNSTGAEAPILLAPERGPKGPLFHACPPSGSFRADPLSGSFTADTVLPQGFTPSVHIETLAGERAKRDRLEAVRLRQPCNSGRRPQILADPGIPAVQHLGRARQPRSVAALVRSNSSLHHRRNLVNLNSSLSAARAFQQTARPALQLGRSQGTLVTVGGSNPGLYLPGTPRSCRELHH